MVCQCDLGDKVQGQNMSKYAVRLWLYNFKHLLFCRFAASLAYFGLTLNSEGIGRHYGIHLYFFLQMLMDVPAFFLALFLLNKIGRKTMLAACMLIGGSSCSITMLTTVFGGKGKLDYHNIFPA